MWTNWIIEARTRTGEFITNWFMPAPSHMRPELVLQAHKNVEKLPQGLVLTICEDGDYTGPPINYWP